MQSATIVIYKFRRMEMKEIKINVTSENRYKITFAIMNELKYIRQKLQEYKRKKIIKSIIPRNPKIKNRKYQKRIKNILYSRNSLTRALKIIRHIK